MPQLFEFCPDFVTRRGRPPPEGRAPVYLGTRGGGCRGRSSAWAGLGPLRPAPALLRAGCPPELSPSRRSSAPRSASHRTDGSPEPEAPTSASLGDSAAIRARARWVGRRV